LVHGGNESAAAVLIQALDRARVAPGLVALSRARDATSRRFFELDVPIFEIEYHPRIPLRFVARLALLVRRFRADGVLCYSYSTIHVWTHLAAVLGGAPGRITRVAGWPTDRRLLGKLRVLNTIGWLLGVRLLAVSHHVARQLRAVGGLPFDSVVTIVNGCDTRSIARRTSAVASRPSDRDATREIVMVARLEEAKDHESVIRAVSELRREGMRVRLNLIGDGPRRSELQNLVERLGLGDAVSFQGIRRDVPEIMASADAVVLATHTEGFPNVLIEAMAVGVPVVASDIPPCREVLDRGRRGWLFPPSDPCELANVLRAVLRGGPEVERRRAKGAEDVIRHYDVRDMARRYEELLVGQRGPGP
jgi:glycosyltransferase involved in cell wall biosynthesis